MMSRTIKGRKGCGYDYWSRRPPNSGMQGHGPFAKLITHRLERRYADREVSKALVELDDGGETWSDLFALGTNE